MDRVVRDRSIADVSEPYPTLAIRSITCILLTAFFCCHDAHRTIHQGQYVPLEVISFANALLDLPDRYALLLGWIIRPLFTHHLVDELGVVDLENAHELIISLIEQRLHR